MADSATLFALSFCICSGEERPRAKLVTEHLLFGVCLTRASRWIAKREPCTVKKSFIYSPVAQLVRALH